MVKQCHDGKVREVAAGGESAADGRWVTRSIHGETVVRLCQSRL